MTTEAAPAARKDPWLETARAAFETSSDWYDANLRKQWERNLSNFQSKHPPGSKYSTGAYAHRSKVFRPKTKSNVRANEASAASAFFSTDDVVNVSAQNDNDESQQASAEVMQELLNHRLTKTIPWFTTLIGAYQDAQVMGMVISKQYWEYEEKVTKSKVDAQHEDGTTYIDPATGDPVQEEVEEIEVIRDKPCVELVPPENIRLDPASDWTDPVNSSPYIVRLIPMYLGDVLAKMSINDPKTGAPKWKKLSAEELLATSDDDRYDTTRRKRAGGRQDSHKKNHDVNEFSTVWVHENIIRKGGKDWVFWTAGVEHMLTDPKPLKEVYLHGRPYVVGCSVIEAHKPFPSGVVEMTQDLQSAANDIQNQRFDNVQLVLNKRYRIRRGANVDLNALMKNVPGGAVLMNDPGSDVVVDSTPDVTTSAYAEQDRINMDFDELAGSFSASSVGSNRQMNETVGGMAMLSGSASQSTEYLLRVFSETWVEPVLRQLVKIEQAYETDSTVLAIAAEKADLHQKYGIDQVTDELLNQELTVTVSVGVGATNPQLQLEKFMMGLNTIAAVPEMMSRIDVEEVTKEVFGKLGYKDGSRFFMTEEKMAEMMQGQEPPPDPAMLKAEIDMQRLQLDGQKLQLDAQIEQMRLEFDARAKAAEMMQEREIEQAKLALSQDLTLTELETKLQMERDKQVMQSDSVVRGEMAKSIDAKIRQIESERRMAIEMMKETTKRQEMSLKRQVGSGI